MYPLPCPAPHETWLLLVRHGATANNRARPPRLQGRRTDPALSEEGRNQADRLARFLSDWPVRDVYTSPLIRARQTAEAIAGPHGLEVQVVDELIEVDVGAWEGRPWDEIAESDPEAYRLFMTDAGVHPYLGGENLATVRDRAVPAFQRLMEENVGRTIAAVAHNVVNRTYLAEVLRVPLAGYRWIPQDNCGLTVLRFRRGETKLVTLNAVFHLED